MLDAECWLGWMSRMKSNGSKKQTSDGQVWLQQQWKERSVRHVDDELRRPQWPYIDSNIWTCSRRSFKNRFDMPHYGVSIRVISSRSFTEYANKPLALILITQPLNQKVLQIGPELIILQHLSGSVMSVRKSFGFGLSMFGQRSRVGRQLL